MEATSTAPPRRAHPRLDLCKSLPSTSDRDHHAMLHSHTLRYKRAGTTADCTCASPSHCLPKFDRGRLGAHPDVMHWVRGADQYVDGVQIGRTLVPKPSAGPAIQVSRGDVSGWMWGMVRKGGVKIYRVVMRKYGALESGVEPLFGPLCKSECGLICLVACCQS